MAAPKILITQPAQQDVDNIVAFLQEQWSEEIAIKFINAFYKSLDLIESVPEIGMRSLRTPTVRRKRIDKFNVTYYELTNEEIYILRVIDSRGNPDANPYQ